MARTFLACGHYAEAPGLTVNGQVECPWGCGEQAVDPEPIGVGVTIVEDTIPFHWNPAFPEPITGRGQMNRLQRQFGTTDYVPSATQADRIKESTARARFERDHR